MLRFDRVLTAPDRAELERTLVAAAEAANKGCRARKLDWAPTDTDALLLDVAGVAEGFRQWNVAGDRKQRRSGQMYPAVEIVWWTDLLRRTHYRVGADRVYCPSGDIRHLIAGCGDRPPLWLTYPEHVYLHGERDAVRPLAVCRCGVAGSPESLGWMGSHCVACHDRAEEGQPAPIPAGEPAATLFTGYWGYGGPLVFTSDGRSLLSIGGVGFGALLWDLPSGTSRGVVCGELPLYSFALSRDGEFLAAASPGGEIVVRAIGDSAKRLAFKTAPSTDRVRALAFSPDGSLLAVAPSGRVELWDLTTLRRQAVLAEGLTEIWRSRCLAFSADGQTLAAADGGGKGVLLWDVASRKCRGFEVRGIHRCGHAICFSPDGRTLGVTTGLPGEVRLVDVASGRLLGAPVFGGARELAFSPDGNILAVAGQDHSLRLFSVPDGIPLAVYQWHLRRLNSVAFSPDGRWLATSSDDSFVKLWPVRELLREAHNFPAASP